MSFTTNILNRHNTEDDSNNHTDDTEAPYPEETVFDMVFNINVSQADTK